MGKIAVIAVHGVADQSDGETAKAVADLLVASSTETVRYVSEAQANLSLIVAPVTPYKGAEHLEGRTTPTAADRPLDKSFKQSFQSDFQRANKAAPVANDRDQPEGAAEAIEWDRGLAMTDYLLGKQIDNHGAQEVYDTKRIDLDCKTDSTTSTVHVYEMYWADLSRLSGAMPRIVAEFGTLLFRLSRLGRDTVDEARGSLGAADGNPGRWALLAFLQSSLDWLFVNALAQVFAQLLMFGVLIIALGFLLVKPVAGVDTAIAQAAFDKNVCYVLSAVLGFVGALLLVYRRRAPRRNWWLPLALIALSVGLLALSDLRAGLASFVLLVLMTIAYSALLKVADERFPLTRFCGLTIWAAMCAGVALKMWDKLFGSEGFGAWRQASLYGVELSLRAIQGVWLVLAAFLVVWLIAGLVAQRGSVEAKASVSTGRLGLGVSVCSFVVVTMALWALLSKALELSVPTIEYIPSLFDIVKASPAASMSGAQTFLDQRYKSSTEAFAPIAVLLLAFFGFVGATLTPSIFAELLVFRDSGPKGAGLKAATTAGRRPKSADEAGEGESRAFQLGRWLTGGYRLLDGFVLLILTLGVALAIVVFYVFVLRGLMPVGLQSTINNLEPKISDWSQAWLAPFIFTAASLGAALSILGGLLSKYVPSLRAPLDTALDVDNYFREFPRAQIPRARIFARYVALLEHVAKEDYTKVVIVAHSQGTMISTELLRWLTFGMQHAMPRTEARAKLHQKLAGDLRILTMGCPLRQLYAARFPTMYRWVLAAHRDRCGPTASDIGVRQWLNLFTSGDYVGRWLWTRGPSGDALAHPLADSIEPSILGRKIVYAGFGIHPPDVSVLDKEPEMEACLGVGAHTHYFDLNQSEVASAIDYLIRTTGMPSVAAGQTHQEQPLVADRDSRIL